MPSGFRCRRFHFWDGRRHPMRFHPENGLWEIFIPKATLGSLYKYELLDANDNSRLKADPARPLPQLRPDTAGPSQRIAGYRANDRGA